MKKQITLLGMLILLANACTPKNQIQTLPDAKIGQPYSVTVDFSNGHRTIPDFFKATISPENSGLSVSGVTGPYDNETTISGTPKIKQDISIKISYFVPALRVIFIDDGTRESYYLIKVKE